VLRLRYFSTRNPVPSQDQEDFKNCHTSLPGSDLEIILRVKIAICFQKGRSKVFCRLYCKVQ
uniref:Uncharacterized protein n=1 Tax=Callorhinchus milii TaxID=7868 RepID=A0A4W3HVG2_CALMI